MDRLADNGGGHADNPVPGMIAAFLESDRGFQRQVASKAKAKT